jgi:hypothetical protein
MTRQLGNKLKKLRDDVIVGEALNLQRLTSEEIANHLPPTIELWNETAEWLDRLCGFGLRLKQENAISFRFKPLYPGAWKRALAVLWLLCGERRYPNHRRFADLDWMLELMFNSGLPADKMKWEATARQGAWNMRLRKTRMNIAAGDAAALRERLCDLQQDQENQHRKYFGIKTRSRGAFGGGIQAIDGRRRYWPDKPEMPQPVTPARAVVSPTDDPATK